MKNSYDPNHLTKRQRHMKRQIPDGVYCDGTVSTKHRGRCPYYHYVDAEHKRSECQFGDRCRDDCSKCEEMISYCSFLKYTEYGQFPLGDMVKVCGIRDERCR